MTEQALPDPQPTRRGVIGHLAGAAVAGAVVSSGIQGDLSESPVMKLFRQWSQLYSLSIDDDATDDEAEAAYRSYKALEQQLFEVPSENARDLLAKIIAYTSRGDFVLADTGAGRLIFEEIRTLAV